MAFMTSILLLLYSPSRLILFKLVGKNESKESSFHSLIYQELVNILVRIKLILNIFLLNRIIAFLSLLSNKSDIFLLEK